MATDATVTDGRRARRKRGRQAVVDAMIAMISEGHAPRSADVVAERAGVSVATLFRYFAGLDDLRAETVARFVERHRDLYDIDGLGDGDLDDRIERFVDSRLALHETIAPVARFVRARALDTPTLADSLAERRAFMTDQIRRHFGAEIEARSRGRREELVGSVVAITSFEAWDLLAGDLGHSPAQIRRGWMTTLRLLLTAED